MPINLIQSKLKILYVFNKDEFISYKGIFKYIVDLLLHLNNVKIFMKTLILLY